MDTLLTEIMMFRKLRESILSEEDAAVVIRISRAPQRPRFSFVYLSALSDHRLPLCPSVPSVVTPLTLKPRSLMQHTLAAAKLRIHVSLFSVMNDSRPSSIDLQAMARQVMVAQGFEPDFPPATRQQLADISAHPPQLTPSGKVLDLRGLLWSSIDNDTSKDLDQIEVAERLPNGDVKVMVGIADVDAFVGKDTPIDQHAAKELSLIHISEPTRLGM